MNPKKIISCIFITCLAGFTQCISPAAQELFFDYVPLQKYAYSKADILPETKVRLLAFSGGPENDKETVYYYQFIVVEESKNDTFRILTPLISVDKEAGLEADTYGPPLQYDPAKGVTEAIFRPQTDAVNLLLQTDAIEALAKTQNADVMKEIKALEDSIQLKQSVVINRRIDLFTNSNFKTAVGILHFKQMPW